MDKVDYEIITLLQENARASFAYMSEKIGLSSPTIKDRMEKMERDDIIRGYRPVLNYSKLGKNVTAFIHVTLESAQSCDDDFALRLGAVNGVVEGHFTDGDYDIFLKVVTESPESLRNVLNMINAVDGVANTKTIISLVNPIREK